ncbi:TetR/AcrR family transcriptional regulator [uncultured Microbacterium sp.]|uniref:TetR/AcrR family transcriptional regulator n=1 Tax=uncultured Microbacterium sp. TaxID=191216 RepID=UPI0035CB743E
MNISETVGLRERKRVKTSEAIHAAAIELVLERGLEAATVDAISERADVSSRTFFNYFPSKEDAVLGVDEAAVTAQLEAPPDYGGDPLIAAFDILYSVFEASGGRRANVDLVRQVVRRNPPLMTRQMLRVAELEGRLGEIVAGWLATDARFAADSDDERLQQARLIIGVCLASIRVSMKAWASPSDAEAEARTVDPRLTYERSITTLRSLLEKLS